MRRLAKQQEDEQMSEEKPRNDETENESDCKKSEESVKKV